MADPTVYQWDIGVIVDCTQDEASELLKDVHDAACALNTSAVGSATRIDDLDAWTVCRCGREAAR